MHLLKSQKLVIVVTYYSWVKNQKKKKKKKADLYLCIIIMALIAWLTHFAPLHSTD